MVQLLQLEYITRIERSLTDIITGAYMQKKIANNFIKRMLSQVKNDSRTCNVSLGMNDTITVHITIVIIYYLFLLIIIIIYY